MPYIQSISDDWISSLVWENLSLNNNFENFVNLSADLFDKDRVTAKGLLRL